MLEGQLEMKRVKEFLAGAPGLVVGVFRSDMLYLDEGAKGLKEFRKPSRVPNTFEYFGMSILSMNLKYLS